MPPDSIRSAPVTGERFRLLAPGLEWSWRSTGDPGLFEIWRNGEAVAMFSVLPGHIEHRAVFLDHLIDHLNSQET